MHGSHNLKAWSSTQPVIALSSGEAEYYGMVKGAGNALGLSGVFQDLGVKHELVVYTDSSAAKGMSNRRGLGKVRHVELNQLWLQDQVARGKITVRKIKGEDNISDSLTKYSGTALVAHYCNWHKRGAGYSGFLIAWAGSLEA